MAAAAGLMAVGGVLGAAGSIQAGRGQYAASKYNAQLADRNAVLALDQSSADAEAQSRESRGVIGSIRANYGGSGVTGGGSVSEVIEFSATTAELDRQNILYKGQLTAMGFKEQAALDRAAGRQAITQSRFQAASQLLTSAGAAKFA